jgi:hypothetical protein
MTRRKIGAAVGDAAAPMIYDATARMGVMVSREEGMTTRVIQKSGAPRLRSGCVALQRMQDAGLGPLGWLAPDFRDCVGMEGREFAEFVADRIARDARTRHRLLRCRTADEMRRVQMRFLADAAAAYNAETGAHVRMLDEAPAVTAH